MSQLTHVNQRHLAKSTKKSTLFMKIELEYQNKEELLKLLSKLTSIITSGKDIPLKMSKINLDIIHMENIHQIGRTQCGLILANGVRAVKIGIAKEKINCEQCKKFIK